jgi:hypothetical protein
MKDLPVGVSLAIDLKYECSFAFTIRISERAVPRKPAVVIVPRKRPKQDRSTRLVDAILQAAVRVLERDGAAGFTTVRVADETARSRAEVDIWAAATSDMFLAHLGVRPGSTHRR